MSLQSDPHIDRMYLCAPQLEAGTICTPWVPQSEFEDDPAQLVRGTTPTNGYNSTSTRSNALHNLVTGDATTTENVTFLGDNTITFASGDNIQTGDLGYLTAFNKDFSLEMWIYYNSSDTWTNSNFGRLVGRGSFAGSHGLVRNTTAGRVTFWVRSGNTSVQRHVDLTDGAWNHVIGTWDNDTLQAMYKNGELADSGDPGDMTVHGTPDTGTWIIGGTGGFSGSDGSGYIGKIAKVRIYKTALSADEVKRNYAASRSQFGL